MGIIWNGYQDALTTAIWKQSVQNFRSFLNHTYHSGPKFIVSAISWRLGNFHWAKKGIPDLRNGLTPHLAFCVVNDGNHVFPEPQIGPSI